jgi:hypothetical protein
MGEEIQVAAEGFWARINHPVIGVFITSSIIWNWEITYYLIRGVGGSVQTVDFIEHEYLCPNNWVNLLFWPGLITLGFLGIAPMLYEGYSNYKLWWKGKAKKLEPILNYEYLRTKSRYEFDLESKKEEINSLLKARKADSENYQKAINDVTDQRNRFEAAYNLTKGRRFVVPAVGEYNADVLLMEFGSLRSQVAGLQQELNNRIVQINNKDVEIGNLREKVLSLQGGIN